MKSMIFRSGVRFAVRRSKLAWLTPRRAASGHIEATQDLKFAAAARIADAVISGEPEAPSSPLHVFDEARRTGGADCGIEPVSSARGPREPSGMQADSGSASAPNARPPAKP